MPELPEVETLCRQMNALLPGREILRIDVLDARLGKIEGLVGRRIESVTRRGKYIQIRMSGGMTAETTVTDRAELELRGRCTVRIIN